MNRTTTNIKTYKLTKEDKIIEIILFTCFFPCWILGLYLEVMGKLLDKERVK